MKILVTGGAGYIGSGLVPVLLAHGHAVRVLDSLAHGGDALLPVWSHPSFEFVHGDVRDDACVARALAGVDAVVHLAAIVGDPACAAEPDLARDVNLRASIGLRSAAEAAGVQRFVFASTCSNYGRMADPNGFVDETSELKPVSLYAETKVGVERALLDAPAVPGFVPTVLRFATIFGVSPRMRFDLTVNEFTIELCVTGRLTVFGEQFWRPYVHARDAARAIALVLEADPARVRRAVFNVGSTTQNFQKQQIVDLILKHVPGQVDYVRRTEDPRDYRVAFEKIERELGFSITRTVPDGIQEVVDLHRAGIVTDFRARRYRNS